jgi:hypothetical protein
MIVEAPTIEVVNQGGEPVWRVSGLGMSVTDRCGARAQELWHQFRPAVAPRHGHLVPELLRTAPRMMASWWIVSRQSFMAIVSTSAALPACRARFPRSISSSASRPIVGHIHSPQPGGLDTGSGAVSLRLPGT